MTFFQIVILAIIQGLAELLPVSSSAHVIIAQKLMGLNPSAPEMTFLLVMLHTGTMFATILFFWKRWCEMFRGPGRAQWVKFVFVATVATGIVGFGLKTLIEKIMLRTRPDFEIEHLFDMLPLISAALLCVGIFILIAGRKNSSANSTVPIGTRSSLWIGIVQGLCLPFRGFSRSGATISTALLMNISRARAEEFSFLLAVVLTPPVIARSFLRLMKHNGAGGETPIDLTALLTPGFIGMIAAFFAGLIALKILSNVLEKGRWSFFGYYCLMASLVVLIVNRFTLAS